ncbi:MAG: chemotaxis protein CheC [Chloroflexota bacterium]
MSVPPLGPWAELVAMGTRQAMSGLSRMLGSDIDVTSLTLRRVPITEMSGPLGGLDAEIVWIYLAVSGSVEGHLVFLYEPRIACGFIDLLMDRPRRTTRTIDAMGYSALGEMGNIVGASFLAAIADATGMSLSPSPPMVMRDNVRTLLHVFATDILTSRRETYLAEATLITRSHDIAGVFMVMPTEELLNVQPAASRVA